MWSVYAGAEIQRRPLPPARQQIFVIARANNESCPLNNTRARGLTTERPESKYPLHAVFVRSLE